MMRIEHPRRLLFVGAPGCDVGGLVSELTGQTVSRGIGDSLAGVLHEWHLTTDYYTAPIPIWIDEISDLDRWRTEFSAPEAREVIEAVGGWIFCFNKSASTSGQNAQDQAKAKATMAAIERVINKTCGYGWEGVKIAVALSNPSRKAPKDAIVVAEWDDLCQEHGFEFVDADASGRNEYGENTGIQRIKECVETNEWSTVPQVETDDENEPTLAEFGTEQAEMDAELMSMKASLLSGDIEEASDSQDKEVQNLEALMQQAMAIKDAGANLPLEARKQFAAKAVNDLMKRQEEGP